MDYEWKETVDYAWGVTTMPWKVQNVKGKEFTDSVQKSSTSIKGVNIG